MPAEMTDAQFACCRDARAGQTTEAVRRVLVDGDSVKTASAATGISEQVIRNAMVTIRKKHREILAAYCRENANGE